MKLDLEKVRLIENNRRYISTMRPVFNKRALYTDTTEHFISPAEPAAYDKVTIKFRTAKNNVDRVLLVYKGERNLMYKTETEGNFDYYSFELQLENEKASYYFEIQTGRLRCYYDTRGLVQEINEYYDFVIIPDFKTPQWAKGAVMYQIYVDRFCNGDTTNDVLTNEYLYINRPVNRVEDWNRYPAQMDVREFYGGDLQGVLRSEERRCRERE